MDRVVVEAQLKEISHALIGFLSRVSARRWKELGGVFPDNNQKALFFQFTLEEGRELLRFIYKMVAEWMIMRKRDVSHVNRYLTVQDPDTLPYGLINEDEQLPSDKYWYIWECIGINLSVCKFSINTFAIISESHRLPLTTEQMFEKMLGGAVTDLKKYNFAKNVVTLLSDRSKCQTCGALKPRYHCKNCTVAWYCNADCQVKDWRVLHKSQCEFIRRFALAMQSVL